MLQSLANAQAKRAYALVSALADREITTAEFIDALRHIPAEVLTVTATVLRLLQINEPSDPVIQQALTLCTSAASHHRISN